MMRGRYHGWNRKSQQPKRGIGSLSRFILRPIVTEKTSLLSAQDQIAFQVPMNVTKNMVHDAVSKIFDVKVLNVNILRRKGKRKTFKGRSYRCSDRKIAYISLEKGKGVDFFKKEVR